LKDPDSIEAGDELTILPTDGVVVSPNQDINLKEIAQKYNVESPQKILEYNDLTKEQLASSEQIIVPTTDIPYSELPHKEARPVNIASGPSAQDVPSGNITHDRMGNGFYEYPAAGSVNPHWQAHKRGVDIDGNYGSPIKAAAPGKVEIAGWHNAGYGYYVVIRHADGSRTLYAHMATNSLTVSEGDHVDRGTVLGQMGNTGYSTGPHLHFEIRP
ncbi:MAG: M23 family metallopeptidase, partial [Candidatus Paceibacteria bacterium]